MYDLAGRNTGGGAWCLLLTGLAGLAAVGLFSLATILLLSIILAILLLGIGVAQAGRFL